MSARSVPSRRICLLGLGFGVWCSAIAVTYALHTFGCAFAWSKGGLRLGLGLVLFAHLAVIGWQWRAHAVVGPDPAFGPTGSFLHWVSVWTLITAFIAVVLTLGPVLLLTICV